MGPDGQEVIACNIGMGASNPILTTQAPIPTPTTFTRDCNLHILELNWGVNQPVYVQANLTDRGTDLLLNSQAFDLSWGQNFTLVKGNTGLVWDIQVGMFNRDGAGATVPEVSQFDYAVGFTAGPSSWTSDQRDAASMPYCEVGAWDAGNLGDELKILFDITGQSSMPRPSRQMDCKFKC